jgi:beta-xylosidase
MLLAALLTSSLLLLAHSNLLTLTDRYTADPAPFVHGDGRLYIYTSHDLPNMTKWQMTDYSLMSTDDLANWRDEGIVFDLKNQTWGVYAWAQQVIQGADGDFYMYYPAMGTRPGDHRSGIGVASSSSVLGPFNDALGHPLLPCGDDPTVFRDENGTVYLCGNW